MSFLKSWSPGSLQYLSQQTASIPDTWNPCIVHKTEIPPSTLVLPQVQPERGRVVTVLWEECGNIRLALTQLPSHQDSSLPVTALRTHFPTNYFCSAWAPHCLPEVPAISANPEKVWNSPSNIMFISTGLATAFLPLPAWHKPPLICAALANRALLALPGWPLLPPPTSVYVTFPTHSQIW